MKAVFFLLFLISCSEQPLPVEVEKRKYIEAFLKSKNVYTADGDVDQVSNIFINFTVDYVGQLVELGFATKKLSTTFLTLQNQVYPSTKKRFHSPSILLDDLRIELDGVDITSCLVAECNNTNCTGTSQIKTKFSGIMNAEDVMLNLTKVDLSTSPACSSVTLPVGNHQIKFRENTVNTGGNWTGGRVVAQVSVFNRPYRIEDIGNFYQQVAR